MILSHTEKSLEKLASITDLKVKFILSNKKNLTLTE